MEPDITCSYTHLYNDVEKMHTMPSFQINQDFKVPYPKPDSKNCSVVTSRLVSPKGSIEEIHNIIYIIYQHGQN